MESPMIPSSVFGYGEDCAFISDYKDWSINNPSGFIENFQSCFHNRYSGRYKKSVPVHKGILV